jgi:hypothetical protein
MINRTLVLIIFFGACVLMSNCSSYGPAYQGHQLAYMETPNYEKGYQKVRFYASGHLGSGAVYQPDDKNTNGSLAAHFGWANPYKEGAFGLYAFTGKYIANINNVEKPLMYNGLGIRMYGAKIIPLNDEIDIHCLGLSLGFNYEDGDFTSFRDTLYSHNTNRLFGNFESALSVTGGLSIGMKLRLQQEQSLIVRYLFGGTSTTVFILPDALFHHFTVNYQFKKASVNASLVVGKAGRVSVNLPFQLGVSVPLYSY